MIELNIPGLGTIRLEHLVCDVNGTIAEDGNLMPGLARSLAHLRDRLQIHLITANTHARADEIDQALNLHAVRISSSNEDEQKAAFIHQLGKENVAAIGQGENDSLMLKEAAIGICVLSQEGTATSALLAADLVVPDIQAALELFEKPLRIVATLRK